VMESNDKGGNIRLMVAMDRAGILGGKRRIVASVPIPKPVDRVQELRSFIESLPDIPLTDADRESIEAAERKRARKAAKRSGTPDHSDAPPSPS
jgi:hypothetical protein